MESALLCDFAQKQNRIKFLTQFRDNMMAPSSGDKHSPEDDTDMLFRNAGKKLPF
jgi:hypothetical protein